MDENETSTTSTPQMGNSRNTPRRYINQRIGTPLQRIKENETSQEKAQAMTPVTTINPFEVKADSLYFPSCSPSVFATFARNKTDNGEFRWSIDHVSLLYPADIDETSIPEQWVDPDHETEAQKAIDAFFSQNSIVPSPWSSESKNRRIAKIRRLSRNSSIHANDVATQTMLTIPPSIDLLSILGNEFMYNENNTPCSSPSSSNSSLRDLDVMSTSSLRRKLFVTEEDCKTPSRLERKDLLMAKQWSTPTINMKSIQSTPSDLLSSSPITPPTCSESCNVRTSPQMSPITGPSSQRSVRMRSFNERLDEESNSQIGLKPSFDYNHMSESAMSFCIDSQEAVTFQSYSSEKQDTGYVTGSMFSLQNTTSEATTSGFQSRITPVTELFDGCAFSNFGSSMSCTNENMSLDCENFKMKENESISFGLDKFSLVPNSCSTPAFNL